MNTSADSAATSAPPTAGSDRAPAVDVLIIGAGLSGIGAACHLRRDCPEHSFLLLESRATLGGTWDLFRYPGIRSDSDMYTLGYSFKPWTDNSLLADGPSILHYLTETAREYAVLPRIRYGHRALGADWDSQEQQWIVSVEIEGQEIQAWRCNFLFIAGGYYSYAQGHTPHFDQQERFRGQLFHAQHWPEDLDYKNKRVVVIGSGATAVTLVPEMARLTTSTIMLQRSPTYVASLPRENGMAAVLRRFLPMALVYRFTRWKRVLIQILVYQISRQRPALLKGFLLDHVRQELGPDFDVDTHFTPRYNPWDQRLCAVPEGDLFEALREGRAEVVTDTIDHFTEHGLQLASGRHLDADIVVLATGLNMQFAGDMQLSMDGHPVDLAAANLYRGMMLSNVPNMATVFGYTNSSWTLKADLVSQYVCRLLNRMKKRSQHTVVARLAAGEAACEEPLLDFDAGYVLRAQDQFPRQGKKTPWRLYQNYLLDFFSLRFSKLNSKELHFK
ncbi:MAG: NAD(P)/FAD-dependent oxidoreductase [Pseudomonadota bacterium]